jgi:uncharacterized protein YggU (UPF0235/DUF167 family)
VRSSARVAETARLRVRVHPGARRPGLVGRLADGSIKLAVAEPAEAGRANRAVESLIAGVLGVARSRVRVAAGAGSRMKQVEIDGLAPAEIERRIAAALVDATGHESRVRGT